MGNNHSPFEWTLCKMECTIRARLRWSNSISILPNVPSYYTQQFRNDTKHLPQELCIEFLSIEWIHIAYEMVDIYFPKPLTTYKFISKDTHWKRQLALVASRDISNKVIHLVICPAYQFINQILQPGNRDLCEYKNHFTRYRDYCYKEKIKTKLKSKILSSLD